MIGKALVVLVPTFFIVAMILNKNFKPNARNLLLLAGGYFALISLLELVRLVLVWPRYALGSWLTLEITYTLFATGFVLYSMWRFMREV
jgi:hypothetical protein